MIREIREIRAGGYKNSYPESVGILILLEILYIVVHIASLDQKMFEPVV